MMRLCSKCMYAGEGKFCSQCGGRTIPYFMPCPYCKKQLAVRHKFCQICGKPVHEEVKSFIEAQRKEVEKSG